MDFSQRETIFHRRSAVPNRDPDNPLITGIVTDFQGLTATYQNPGWFPANLYLINRLPLSQDTLERLVVIPTQYKDGTLRQYSGLEFAVFSSASINFTPPNIRNVASYFYDQTAHFSVLVNNLETLHRVLVTYQPQHLIFATTIIFWGKAVRGGSPCLPPTCCIRRGMNLWRSISLPRYLREKG